MRPTVHDPRCQFDRQTRAYAEYRVFFGLTTAPAGTTAVTVTLAREASHAGGGQDAVCILRLTTCTGDQLETHATAHHPYAAIDRATELMLAALQDRAVRVRTLATVPEASAR
jgi:hypothetical protein